jgi:2-C-methyl-D-erythritol 4-phosphate cytidylyltransferase
MISAILVAAGKGVRMGADVDKLFLEVAGRPVMAHTWLRFDEAKCIDEIILVVRDGMQVAFKELPPTAKIVVIHDAARPCTSGELIAATIKAAEETGAAVAAQPVTDTIKESADGKLIRFTLDRSLLWAVQTPQTFRVEVIRRALTEARRRKLVFTDDTAACELIGQPVRLVPGIAPNPKITMAGDLPFVEMLLRNKT